MNIKRTSSTFVTGLALLGAVTIRPAHAQGTWNIVLPADPINAWTNNGTVVKASNLGPAGKSQPVTVAGISFDTDLSNVTTGGDGSDFTSGYIPESPAITELYYSGANLSVSNLENTFAWVHCWWGHGQSWGDPDQYLSIAFDSLVVGHNYQFQLLVGFPWDGDGINIYGGDAANTYAGYWASGTGQGKNMGMATFTWTATDSSGTVSVTEPYAYAEHELLAYALIDTSVSSAPVISSPQLLAGGKFDLTINSTANATLDILLSHDLKSWVVAGTVTNVTGVGIFTNNSATSSPTFYRLLQR